MSYSDKVVMLDCTLRDGGYYTNWHFDESLINDYLFAMSESGIDVVELGFRFLDVSGFRGALAYSRDDYIAGLKLPKGLALGVMINASDLYGAKSSKEVVDRLFPNTAADSVVSVVRIASHFHELERCLEAVEYLSDMGFQVGINLMQVALRTDDELRDFAARASKTSASVLYVADSTGSLNEARVEHIMKVLSVGWSGDTGLHAHDNMGLALSNTSIAITAGATWVDSTVTGMGRGPGNTRTEELLVLLDSTPDIETRLAPLVLLISNWFGPSKAKFGWGSNLFYYLSGVNGIHPTFVQEMLADSRYSETDILAVLKFLKGKDASKYSPDDLLEAKNFYSDTPIHGSWHPTDIVKQREVVILGPGLIKSSDKAALSQFIKSKAPVVLALNSHATIEESLIDARVVCHPIRILADLQAYKRFDTPLVMPVSAMPSILQDQLAELCCFDFGLSIKKDTFRCMPTGCQIHSPLALGYAIAVGIAGGAQTLYLAGFEGYEKGDVRNQDVEHILDLAKSRNSNCNLVFTTPTNFKGVEGASIYAL